MQIWTICAVVFGAGCFGGLVNALIAGELYLPRIDRRARVWRPGWIGNVIVGGTAAFVFWGLYGPLASVQIIGDGAAPQVVLHVSELLGSVVSGIGGGRLLSAEVDRRLLRSENQALTRTKANLAGTIDTLGRRERR
jgi:hypothetical protein